MVYEEDKPLRNPGQRRIDQATIRGSEVDVVAEHLQSWSMQVGSTVVS